MNDGVAGLYLFGHGASLQDPYDAPSNCSTAVTSASIGTSAGNNRYSRYKTLNTTNCSTRWPRLVPTIRSSRPMPAKASGIYWRDTIDIPIIQWLHRIPYNNTYWTNWPSSNQPGHGHQTAHSGHTRACSWLLP